MSRRTLSSVLVPAVLLGILGWSLTNDLEAGINRTLWLLLAVGTWIGIRRWNEQRIMPDETILLAAIAGLALALGWRDDEMLTALNTMAIAISFGLLPLAAREERSRLWDLRVWEVIESGVRFGMSLLFGLIPEVVEAHRERERRSRPSVVAPVIRGLIFCAILLPIFGSLLADADADFSRFLNGLLTFNHVELPQEIFIVGVISWLGAGLLSGSMVQRERVPMDVSMVGGKLGTIEVGMVLGMLNLLFTAFIGFQVSHFFGGAHEVASAAGLTLSSYAREGFFQLVVVAGLVVPVLLFFESRVRETTTASMTLYRWLAIVMVALVFAIMASAMQRMVLYQREFGLTVDRFFASAAMAGIAVTLGWLVFTVLRGASQRFAGGFLVAWAAWLGLLNLANPQRIIVDANLARIESGKAIDLGHLAQLQGDAVPAIVGGLDRLTAADRTELLRRLARKDFSSHGDWRAFHLARSRAERLLRQVGLPDTIGLNGEQHLCRETCQLAYRVTGLQSLSREGSTAEARVWVVTVSVTFDAASLLSGQDASVRLSPGVQWANLVDVQDRRYYQQSNQPFVPAEQWLSPGDTRELTLTFELPAGVTPTQLLIDQASFTLPKA